MAILRGARGLALVSVVSLCSFSGLIANGAAFAQAQTPASQRPSKPTPPPETTKSAPDEGVLAPIIGWLERANREYQDTVVQQLSVPTGRGGDATPPQPNAPDVIQQVQEWLGLGGDKTTTTAEKPPSPAPVPALPQVGGKDATGKTAQDQGELEKRATDEALRRQRDARALEAQRTADEQRLLAEAKKAKDAVDQATRERQAIAENGRLAEEQRRTAGAAVLPKEPVAAAAKDEKAAVAKQAEARALDQAKALAEQEAAATKKAQKSAETKPPSLPSEPKTGARAPDTKPDAKSPRDSAEKSDAQKDQVQLGEAGRRDTTTAKPQEAAKTKPKSDNDARDAERLAAAANRAGSSAMEKITRTGRGQKATTVSAATASREAKHRTRDSRKCRRAGEDVDPPATYIVKQGDTLWSISRRHYDKGHRFERIVRANDSKIDDPDMIFPCQKLMLPG